MKERIISIEDAKDKTKSTLKLKSAKVTFPLSQEDKNIIEIMREILFSLDGVGLAAPQIDINKNIAAIYIPESSALLRDNAKEYPMHFIINAHYEAIERDGIYSDFEGCYSVKTVYGNVPRYNSIIVRYQTEDGKEVSKTETGFYARVLQHEIDHLQGLLITDRLTSDCLQGSFEEMIKYRRASLSKERLILLDKLIEQKKITPIKK